MAFNFLGVGLFLLLIASGIGLVLGVVLKKAALKKASLAVLAVVLVLYLVSLFLFH